MKRLTLITLLLLVGLFCLAEPATETQPAQQQAVTTKVTTLRQLVEETTIPAKRLRRALDYPDTLSWDTEITVSQAKVDQAKAEFLDGGINTLSYQITLLGMLVVFASLVLIGIIIAQLKHLASKPAASQHGNATQVAAPAAKAEPQPDISTNALVAAITALHLHILDIEAQENVLLTYKRVPTSSWKSFARTNSMPNSVYKSLRS